jgi:hypothetical protein
MKKRVDLEGFRRLYRRATRKSKGQLPTEWGDLYGDKDHQNH